ncbi:ATP-binding protein [Marinobacter manganoxydans]|uniref:histidine kinase n=1 Tax=Marinobacter manganoxydans MnI7-9 TaxID=1094979 RepID=G6YNC9_9GAMM|nr:ATP-binding protein [Marinobacter manganoxydans]EHJ06306.1 integral membrane sensor hybrid histidine kinase [Marinobacter manganoxydans MnI7-9]
MLTKLYSMLGQFSPAFRDLSHLEEHHKSFEAQNWIDRAYLNQIGCIVSIIIVTLGIPLDYIVYPEYFVEFAALRVGEVVFLSIMFFVTTLDSMRPHVFKITAIFTGSVIATVAVIIYVTEGAVSPYYAGINLVLIGIGFIMGLTFKEALAYSLFAILSYLFVSVLAGVPDGSWRIVIINGYFIFLTGVIAVIAAYFGYRIRFYSYAQEVELQKSNTALQEMDRRKSEFIANVSHELRTPVAVIVGPAKHLLEQQSGQLPPSARKVVEQIVRNGGRLIKLVNDLLELMVLENTTLAKDSYTRVDLKSILNICTDQLAPLFGSNNSRVLNAVTPRYPVWVDGNESQLERVCFNLIQNAYKFTDPGNGQIDVELAIADDFATLKVKDNGVGIDPKNHDMIFQRYRQVDGSTTRKAQGTGIGLALVKEIVEAHSGTIAVYSQLGWGSTFTLQIPLAQNQTDAIDPKETANNDIRRDAERDYLLNFDVHTTPETANKTYRSEGKPLLVLVEDENDIASMMLDALQADYDLVWLKDGSSAAQEIESLRPHVVLLDHMLPGKDGLDIAREMKRYSDTSTTPILLVTANARDTLKQDALDLGIDEFIAKPFSWVELRARVKNLVNRANLERVLSDRNTELQIAMDDLSRSEAQLIQSEKWRSLSSFSGALIHEIGNPLNIALSALRVAVKQTNPEIRAEALDDAKIGLERISDLIADLKDFLTPENTPVLEPVSLEQVIDRSEALHRDRLANVVVHHEGLSEAFVIGNKNALIQTISNLIGNSLDAFARRDLPNPSISICATSDQRSDGSFYRIQVSDNGPGIPESVIPMLFTPFHPGPESTSLGIGLSLCKKMVEQMGGEIILAESLEGASFEISLPSA